MRSGAASGTRGQIKKALLKGLRENVEMNLELAIFRK